MNIMNSRTLMAQCTASMRVCGFCRSLVPFPSIGWAIFSVGPCKFSLLCNKHWDLVFFLENKCMFLFHFRNPQAITPRCFYVRLLWAYIQWKKGKHFQDLCLQIHNFFLSRRSTQLPWGSSNLVKVKHTLSRGRGGGGGDRCPFNLTEKCLEITEGL